MMRQGEFVPVTGAGNPNQLLNALTRLMEMMQCDPEPAVAEVEPIKAAIDANQILFGLDRAVLAKGLDLISAYDQIKGPLFVAREGWDKKNPDYPAPPADDIHWTIYHVMQYVFDYAYTLEGIQACGDLLAGFSFGSHVHFPGPVVPPASADVEYNVLVDATSPADYPTFELLENPRRPTGAYVAPGHLVTIHVPACLVRKGYQLRVGAHSWDNSIKKNKVTRLARVSKVYDIEKEAIEILHPLGGGVYIEVPKGADDGVVEFLFKGAVRAPLFAATHFLKTTNEEWAECVRKRSAPWSDFHSDKFMMQLPTMWVYNLMDPVKLLSDWDKACDAQNELFGQPLVKTQHTHYLQVDLQNRGRSFFPGYPTCNDRYDPNLESEYAGYADHYLVRGPQVAPHYVFHEQGHQFCMPKYPGEQESVVNLPHVAVWNRKFGYDLDHAFSASRGEITDTVHTVDRAAIAWMCSESFPQEVPMQVYEKQYQWKGHAKYVEIVRLFGWDVLHAYWRAFNDEVRDGVYKGRHEYTNDEITIRTCRAAQIDLRPLLRFWGIHEDAEDVLAKQIAAEQLPPSVKIYDRLQHYASLLPADRASFRQFALLWWGRQPSVTGFSTERAHASFWDTYDEQTAVKLQKIVQGVIQRYFSMGVQDSIRPLS